MSLERVKKLLKEKEDIRLEFKEAVSALPENLFETICAMLNRDGGDILLGVDDKGKVIGVDETAVETMITNLVNLSNNPQKLDSPFILFPQVHIIKGKSIIHIQIPASSQVHNSVNNIFDRSNDGDFKVTRPYQIAEIYNRKRTHYTESIVYPALRFSDFKESLFPKIRNLIRSNNYSHPWLSLDDKQLLEKAGLWKQDFQTGKEGYTLAAALLLGKDEVIQQILPYYKIDALVRVENKLRYDDRLYIQSNLIEAYEQLMEFTAKHLPDKFYLEGDQRISLRSAIFREVAANLIVHREYTNAQPCIFVIHPDRVETENANNPHGEGPIDPDNFTPFPKNPTIAKFFIQLGRVDELGSGVLNVNRFIKEYSGKDTPEFIEGRVFKMIIPIPEMKIKELQGVSHAISEITGTLEVLNEGAVEGAVEGAIEGATNEVKQKLIILLKAIAAHEGERVPNYKLITGLSEKSIERYIKILKEAALIEFIGEAPQTGGYYLTKRLKGKLQ